MLDALMKKLNIGTKEDAEAATEVATETLTVTVDTTTLQAELDAIKAEFGTQLEQATAALAEMTSKFEAAQAALAAVEAEKAEMLAKAAEAKLTARKEKVVAAIGTDKADALMAATVDMDDAQFTTVVSALAGSVEAEAKTDLFVEQGVAAEADAAKVVEESPEMKIIRAKYPAAK